MLAWKIEDMTCGGCVRSIRAAVASVAPTATVHADLETKLVAVDGTDDAQRVGAAIASAGFDAVRVDAAPAVPAAAKGGCGGGGCRCG